MTQPTDAEDEVALKQLTSEAGMRIYKGMVQAIQDEFGATNLPAPNQGAAISAAVVLLIDNIDTKMLSGFKMALIMSLFKGR